MAVAAKTPAIPRPPHPIDPILLAEYHHWTLDIVLSINWLKKSQWNLYSLYYPSFDFKSLNEISIVVQPAAFFQLRTTIFMAYRSWRPGPPNELRAPLGRCHGDDEAPGGSQGQRVGHGDAQLRLGRWRGFGFWVVWVLGNVGKSWNVDWWNGKIKSII